MGNSRNRSIWSRFMNFISRTKKAISQSANRNRYNYARQQRRPVKAIPARLNTAKFKKAINRTKPAYYLPKPVPKPRHLDNRTLKKQLDARSARSNNENTKGMENLERAGNFLKSKFNDYASNTMKFISTAGDVAGGPTGRMRRYSKQLNSITKQMEPEEDKWIEKTHEKSIKQMEKAKKGLGSTGKKAMDVTSSVIDAGVAFIPVVGTPVSAAKGAGSRLYDAEENGATKSKALKYALGMGAVDVTLGKLVPKGLTKGTKSLLKPNIANKKIMSKATEKSTSKFSPKGEKGKAPLYQAAKFMKPSATGAVESALSEIADPMVRNLTYSKDEKIDWNNVIREGTTGAISRGVYGTLGKAAKKQGSNYLKKNGFDNYKNIRALINEGLESSEKTVSNKFANKLLDDVKSGKQPNAAQIKILQEANDKAIKAESKTYGKQQAAAEAIAKNHGLAPIMTKLDNGKVVIGKAASQQLENTTSRIAQKLSKSKSMDEERANNTATSIGRIMTGLGDNNDFSTLMPSMQNETARKVYMEETKSKLPNTNEGTRAVLSKANMKNMLLMREKETLSKGQQKKQSIMEEAEKNLGKNGVATFTNAVQQTNQDYDTTAREFKKYYDGGTVSYPIDNIHKVSQSDKLPYPLRLSAWQAGRRDSEARKQAAQEGDKNNKHDSIIETDRKQIERIKENAPHGDQQLKELVIKEFYHGDKKTFEKAIDQKIKTYANNGKKLSKDEAFRMLLPTLHRN